MASTKLVRRGWYVAHLNFRYIVLTVFLLFPIIHMIIHNLVVLDSNILINEQTRIKTRAGLKMKGEKLKHARVFGSR